MKVWILCLGFLIFVTLLIGTTSDTFIIGAYSQYMLHRAGNTAAAFDSLGKLLSKADYNTVLYSMREDAVKQGRLAEALVALSKYNIGSVVDDWTWQKDGQIGVAPLAYGNHLKMEAEYNLDFDGTSFTPDILDKYDNSEDKFNYVFRHYTGGRSERNPTSYSNEFAWICDANDGHKAGLLLAEPRFRWKPINKTNSRLIGWDFKFFIETSENRLYIRVAMNWKDLEPGAEVASIAVKVLRSSMIDTRNFEYKSYPDSCYLNLPLKSVQPELYGTTIVNKDYDGVPFEPQFGNYIFEFYTEIPQAGSALAKDIIQEDHFYHLNPEIYWHGSGKMCLDYIDIEDETYRALANTSKTPHPFLARLAERLYQINSQPGAENILYYYAKDEPFQGQFASYDKLEIHLNAFGKHLITATHHADIGYKKLPGSPDYSHFGLFLKEAKPEVVMLDSYPLQEWGASKGTLIRWNGDLEHDLFVQNKMETLLLANYQYLAGTIKHDPEMQDTKLFFVPQTFGEKVEPVDSGEWLYFMPPRSMQRCLQLLPLCYAADGIVDFAIAANADQSFPRTDRTFRRVTPLTHSRDYSGLKIRDGLSAYDHLKAANAKIKIYGPIIQSMNWVEADSIMVKGTHPKLDLQKLDLSALEVVQADNGKYEGYVQCGYYQDSEGNPSFMLVNRRSVYKRDNSSVVASFDVDADFIDADPQTVRFTLNAKSSSSLDYALFDTYTQQYYQRNGLFIDVPIAPGDGILLHMVRVSALTVSDSSMVDQTKVLEKRIKIKKNGSLDFTSDSQVEILEGTVITVEKGATLCLMGNTRFQKNVKIILKPGAVFNYNEQSTSFNTDTVIIKKKPCWLKRLFGAK